MVYFGLVIERLYGLRVWFELRSNRLSAGARPGRMRLKMVFVER